MIGDNIRKIRIEKKISTIELATTSGLSRATIDKIEHSRLKDIKLSTLQKIANALDVDISALITKK